MRTNVYAIPAQNYPGCPTCNHDWHGIACTQTRWVNRATRPITCPCQTSIDTDVETAA